MFIPDLFRMKGAINMKPFFTELNYNNFFPWNLIILNSDFLIKTF